ncbi:MAG: FAD-dependent oxidoreductase, partial [Acidimicrobiales bacterium]
MALRFVVIGGGPAGNTAATTAARFGAEVTLVERDVVGGAAHLWDCIPSKAMIATGGAMTEMRHAASMGLVQVDAEPDFDALRQRIAGIEDHLESAVRTLLESQGVRLLEGCGRLVDPYQVEVTSADGEITLLPADVVVLSTGSRPRIPDWATIDGQRVLTTRHAYPPPTLPEHLIVVGSGVTGVEFVHMFSAFGSQVTLIVSRQQVLPQKDPEVAAVLEDDFIKRGVKLFKGARAEGIDLSDDGVAVRCDDGRVAQGSHVLLCIGSLPNSEDMGLEDVGIDLDGGYVVVDHNCKSSVPHVYAAGDLSGKLPLSSVASMQGRKIAEHALGLHAGPHRHLDYEKAASAIFTDPEIADVGLAEVDA